jgi:hypothetical protein
MSEAKTPRPWLWLRAVAVVLALFALGHTVGTAGIPSAERCGASDDSAAAPAPRRLLARPRR